MPKYDPHNIIICFSGGKDSFSTIRHYQKLNYNVYLYHIKGINKTYYDEWKVAQEMANKLGLPIYFDELKYSGNHIWCEHPMKNMIIANMALTYGIQNNITTHIAFGDFNTASLDDNSFEVCGGDCKEMWDAYIKIIKRICKTVKISFPISNYGVSLNTLLVEPEYLPYTISCMTPNRFRQSFRNRTLNKYNINLLPHRCGCCWKCASEYIWYADHNVLDYNQDYYIHCLEVLRNTFKKENGYNPYTLEYLWEYYFFYPFSESHIYPILDTVKLCGGKFYYITDNGMERI